MTPEASADGGGRQVSRSLPLPACLAAGAAWPASPGSRHCCRRRLPDLRSVRSLLDGRPSTGSPRCCMLMVVSGCRSVAWTVVGDPAPLADRQQRRPGRDHAQPEQHPWTWDRR